MGLWCCSQRSQRHQQQSRYGHASTEVWQRRGVARLRRKVHQRRPRLQDSNRQVCLYCRCHMLLSRIDDTHWCHELILRGPWIMTQVGRLPLLSRMVSHIIVTYWCHILASRIDTERSVVYGSSWSFTVVVTHYRCVLMSRIDVTYWCHALMSRIDVMHSIWWLWWCMAHSCSVLCSVRAWRWRCWQASSCVWSSITRYSPLAEFRPWRETS